MSQVNPSLDKQKEGIKVDNYHSLILENKPKGIIQDGNEKPKQKRKNKVSFRL